MKVIIPLAGLGTRLRPHTHTKPKPLVSVAGKPVLAHILDKFQSLDVEEYIFIVGHLGEQIKEYVEKNYDFQAKFVEQREPKGQAHAIHLARKHITSPILLIFVDTIFEVDLSCLKDATSDGLVFVKEVDDPRRFGIALLEDGFVTRFIEKPEIPVSNLALVGMYYVNNWPLFLECVRTLLEKGIQTKGEYYLADAFQLMADRGARLEAVKVDVWEDCGKPETLLSTQRYLLDRNGSQTGETENSIVLPPVYIAETAKIKNSIIGPYVSIAEGCVVVDSIIRDSIVDEEALIERATLEGSLIGAHAQVKGDFKRLDVGDSSRVDFG